MGEQAAWNNRTPIYLISSAIAETIADVFLCPYEACRIRLVSDPTYASSLMGTAQRMSSVSSVFGMLSRWAGSSYSSVLSEPHAAARGRCRRGLPKTEKGREHPEMQSVEAENKTLGVSRYARPESGPKKRV